MVKKLQALKAKKGFTLVELIVVIAIIGVLAAILVPTMMNVVTKARVSSADQTAKSVADTVTEWLADLEANRGTIPADLQTLQISDIGSASIAVAGDIANFSRGASAAAAKTNLEDTFKENYVSNKSGYAIVLIKNRHVVGCAYSDDATAVTQLTALSMTDATFSGGTFTWASSSKEGITTDAQGGIIVGTNPKLLMS